MTLKNKLRLQVTDIDQSTHSISLQLLRHFFCLNPMLIKILIDFFHFLYQLTNIVNVKFPQNQK